MQELVHRHDRDLELTLLACGLIEPECVGRPWAEMPIEVFYREDHRVVWKEMRRQLRDHGSFDTYTLCTALNLAGHGRLVPDVVIPAFKEFADGGFMPTAAYASLYAHQLKRLYVVREKAKATQQYQAELAAGDTDENAKLLLDGVLTALDAMVRTHEERTDEELAALIGPGSRFPTGLQDVDRKIGGMAKPGLNVLAARPSVGKTALARTIIRKLALRDQRVFWYSQDQGENQILELEIAYLRRISTEQVRGISQEEALQAIAEIRSDVWRDNVTLIDRPLPLAQLLSTIHGATPDFVVIDYLQIIDTGHDRAVERVATASSALKTLALQLRIPILALAQLSRGFEHGMTPTLAHLKESGQIEQDADQVWILDRDTTISTSEEQLAQLWILKNKVGPTGKVPLHWHGKTASYEQAARVST